MIANKEITLEWQYHCRGHYYIVYRDSIFLSLYDLYSYIMYTYTYNYVLNCDLLHSCYHNQVGVVYPYSVIIVAHACNSTVSVIGLQLVLILAHFVSLVKRLL